MRHELRINVSKSLELTCSKLHRTISKAGDEIQEFLEGASSETTGWLQPAEDLGGKPFEFSLIPDKDYPYERVRLYLAHGVVGTTRAAIFDDDVLVK